MAFTVNHKEAGSDILLPEGEYEVIIKNAFLSKTANGAECISLRLTVRNDCGQKYENYMIFDNLYKRREPTPADMAVDGYSAKQIQTLSKSAGLPDGKNYSGIDEWVKDLVGKLLRVTIKHEDYNGKKNARVQWRNETKRPNCTHIWKDINPAAENIGFTEESNEDDDVPF